MATFKELMSAIISKLNCKVASVNGTTPDENGNVEVQSGVQSDWHMNNETSPAFVKNRPFYTGEPSFTEIIPEQTYTMSPFISNFTMYVDQSGTYPYSLEVGKEYTVVYNGTTYELTSNMLDRLAYVGDASPLTTGAEPSVPFAIAAENGILQIIDYIGNTEVTFKISCNATEIKQIDTKYIPWDDAVGLYPPVFINKSVEDFTDEEKQKYYDLFNKGSLLLARPERQSTWGIVTSMFYSRTVGLDMALLDSTGTLYTYSSSGWKINDITKSGMTYTINDILSSKTAWRLLDKTFASVSSGKAYTAYIAWNDSTEKACIRKESKGPGGFEHVPESSDILCSGDKEIVLSSSTSNSTKKFKITVDDSGIITSTNTSDSSISYTPYSPPAVTEADAGKFLRVSSTGEWAAESISNAEGVSF